MKTHFSISINSPCSERFNQFEKTVHGGFCNSCQKEIIDFRHMSDEQILDYLELKQGNTCGHFKSSQINRAMKTSNSSKFLKVAAIAIFALFSLNSIQAQDQNNTKTEQVRSDLLTGVIQDESGPLAGASIVLKGTKIGVTADFEGKFKFPKALKKGDILVVSYIGYEHQNIEITDHQKFLKVQLTGDDIDLLGEVQTNKIYSSKGR
ncbi:carboxypeptidase-like regulatory domain-containing protein [Hyunsoonleella sp. SJ7]|uniref:Carboxypeptidase-like regulatory domain-containing protein n=1 Tax=Hyunsoonleella aquatilis TaxID=2762758 RepID=A0A923H9A2_9FLAO|nr:carboxypeptidase-like regulatory domain-containing protein [Hyunsoonleella aquatilis]MBC3759631.1 carboxypeptidase-like regulatory domain-containing protein [Hyunsoonleella aquatilis]